MAEIARTSPNSASEKGRADQCGRFMGALRDGRTAGLGVDGVYDDAVPTVHLSRAPADHVRHRRAVTIQAADPNRTPAAVWKGARASRTAAATRGRTAGSASRRAALVGPTPWSRNWTV